MLAPTLKLKIHLKSYHPFYLDNFILQVRKKLSKIYVLPMKHIFLPKKIERFTILKSPHVDKKARDQFERITHNRMLILEVPLKHLNTKVLTFYRILQTICSLSMLVEIRVEYEIKNN